MAETYEIDQACTVYATFVDSSGVPRDPFAVSVVITPPPGLAPYTLVYGVDAALTRTATVDSHGVTTAIEYATMVGNSIAGQWTARFLSHGPSSTPLDGQTAKTIYWVVVDPAGD